MNLLLLSNSAPNYFHFFNSLAARFAKDGHRIVAATDCSFSREENQLDQQGFDAVYDFSSFLAGHQTDRAILQRYAGVELNAALLSDFERAQLYGIWDRNTDIYFFDRLKSALLTYFEYIFERHDIDAVLYENVSNTFAYFALFVAERKGATYCGLISSRLPGRFSVVRHPLNDSVTKTIFNDIRSGRVKIAPDIRQWARAYIDRIEYISPDYMNFGQVDPLHIIKRYARLSRVKRIAALIRHTFDNGANSFQMGNPLRTHLNLFLRNLKRRVKASRVRKLYDKPVDGEHFLLYPLHFHPESSTSVLSPTYLDEYEVIRNIAFSLPEGIRLYVKDHVSAWAFPSLKFYRRVKALPNVRMLGPEQPTKQLIRASAAVITLTSTVGYEALLLNKKVFLYGRVFYEFHKGVIRVENPATLHTLIAEQIGKPIDWDEIYNTDFVAAYYFSTLAGTLNLTLDAEKASALAECVYEELVRTELGRDPLKAIT